MLLIHYERVKNENVRESLTSTIKDLQFTASMNEIESSAWYSFAKTQKNKNPSGNHKAEKRRIGGKYAFQLSYSRL